MYQRCFLLLQTWSKTSLFSTNWRFESTAKELHVSTFHPMGLGSACKVLFLFSFINSFFVCQR